MFTFQETIQYESALTNAEAFENDRIIQVHGEIDRPNCPYCLNPNVPRFASVPIEPPNGHMDSYCCRHLLRVCGVCGWFRYRLWAWDLLWGGTLPGESQTIGVLSKQPLDADELPLRELCHYLSTHWGDRTIVSAANAERIVASVFAEHLDCEITYVTNGVYSRDGGIDFVLVNTATGINYAFQVKRRQSDRPERVQEVREFIGSVAMSPFNHAYYVTTADRFTKAVAAEVKRSSDELSKRRMDVQLVDGRRLYEILRSSVLRPSGAQFLARRLPSVYPWFKVPETYAQGFQISSSVFRYTTQSLLAEVLELAQSADSV